MTILVLFEQFSGKVCSYFWPLIQSASPSMRHFVRTVSIMGTYSDLSINQSIKLVYFVAANNNFTSTEKQKIIRKQQQEGCEGTEGLRVKQPS